ncbi:hypothetical protein PV08_02875 [Exophiala spinifera]|uniref:KOW domain-containing protein n=1 Tax=Exophiala spinifera TaxID=91928 RepID=A0A0D2A0U3_9EURO|nr:uncharacterized protein PV08_02875 [Exophiala spinifera]KIW18587.1 hypothetical protein PV08_02875 [Exophiala spinifera]
MQKILRINLQARNQALKAERRKNLKDLKSAWREHDRRQIEIERVKRKYVKEERKNRREDWLAGPLAPKRNVAEKAATYGAASLLLHDGPTFPERALKGPKNEEEELEGFGNEGNIVVGDRVCVVSGHQGILGRIGQVIEVHRERKEITIEGVNMADLETPLGTKQSETRPVMSAPLPVPIDTVRLVHKLVDEATGHSRDVIVKHIRYGAPYLQRLPYSQLPRHTRYIAGEDIEIPWPEDDAPAYQAYEGDTLRLDVEAQTFQPSLYTAPLRPGIMDELRTDKYSPNRKWHEDDYVRMKILEDARSRWYTERRITTPKDELAQEKKRLAAERAAQIKEHGVSNQTLSLIGEILRQKEGKSASRR